MRLLNCHDGFPTAVYINNSQHMIEFENDNDDDDESEMELPDAPESIVVENAGNPAVCGVYQRHGNWEGAHKYSKQGEYEGRIVQFSISKCTIRKNTKYWYISIVPSHTNPGTTSDIDFYAAPGTEDCRYLPPQDGWTKCEHGEDPSPLVEFRVDGAQPTNHGGRSCKAKRAHQGEEEPSTTVKFNVGGKVYEVSRSLVNRFPATMLAKKAKSSSSPVFIDRDSDRFAFCLDYMRDNGKVYLPETVSKRAFLEDLKFFGFVDIDESKIIGERKPKQNCIAGFHQVVRGNKRRIEQMEKELEVLENARKRKKSMIGMEKAALTCLELSLKTTDNRFYISYNTAKGLDNAGDQYFKDCCDKLALRVDGCTPCGFYLSRKTNTTRKE